MTLEIAEGTRLRITVETLGGGEEAPAVQVLEVVGEKHPYSEQALTQALVSDQIVESSSSPASGAPEGQSKAAPAMDAEALSRPLPDARMRWALGLGSLILLCLGLLGWISTPRQMGMLPTMLVLLGLLLLGLAVVSWRKGLPVDLDRFLAGPAGWLGVSPAQVLCLAIGLLFAISAGVAAGTGNFMVNPALAVAGWLLSVVLSSSGDGKALRRDTAWHGRPGRLPGCSSRLPVPEGL